MADRSDDASGITRQDTMKGVRGEWFLWIVAVFVIVAVLASWAGGWWSDEGQDASAPVATEPLTPQEQGGADTGQR